MKINVIKISREEYIEVKTKADKYDALRERWSAGAAKTNNISKAELSARNRKAVQARWSKQNDNN